MGNVAPAALELVDAEMRRIVYDAEDIAKQILAINAEVLQDLANSLLRTETLSGPSLDVYMEAVIPWRDPLIKDLVGHMPPITMQLEPVDDQGDQKPWREPEPPHWGDI
jgi:hypothetical protein